MRFAIVHRTHYEYSHAVTLCHNEAHLRPRRCPDQVAESSELHIEPGATSLHERLDYFGNPCTYFAIQESHRELTVEVKSTVRVGRDPQRAFASSQPWDQACDPAGSEPRDDRIEARQFLFDSPFVVLSPRLAEYATPSFVPGRPLLEAARDLCGRIYREFVYDRDFSTIATPLADVLEQRRGVCQDFAHLAIGCMRSLGLPARYVSGYIETMPSAGQPRLRGSDASHAWFSLYDPVHGWIDLDPTNDQVVGAHHVVTAWGRDYSDVTPLKGIIFGGGTHVMDVSVDMVRLPEAAAADDLSAQLDISG